MSNFSELDALMGFDPSNTSIFDTAEVAATSNPLIYKTNPVDAKDSEDGHYHSRIRLLYNPFNSKRSIIHSATYNIQDQDGYLTVKSLLGAAGDVNSPYYKIAKTCPLFKSWKQLHFSEDPEKQALATKYYSKREVDYILVQIIEDDNQPDKVGQFMVWKLPMAVRKKLEAKMKPSASSKKAPVNILDYLIGRVLEVDVTPGPGSPKDKDGRYFREINYDLCEFDSDVQPITRVDGSPLFTDEEVELIEKYDKKLTAIAKMQSPEEKASSYEMLKKNTLYTQVCELMKRAYEYLKDNAVDIVDVVDYKPWDEQTTARVQRWINNVAAGIDPVLIEQGSTTSAETTNPLPSGIDEEAEEEVEDVDAPDMLSDVSESDNPADDLPF